MNDASATPSPNVPWVALLQDGRAGYSVMVVLGAMLHALQILVIAIIMPTVVKDVGGTEYYTWAAMLYTIGSIVGAASIGPVWRVLGARRGSVASGLLLMVGTTGCALAPDMASLIIARTVQGYAGGLVIGGTMALVSGLFDEGLRRRILTAYQGTWMVAQLLGPVVGGLFAEIGWWRGSFWSMLPFTLCFIAIAWIKLPDRMETDVGKKGPFPLARLAMLIAGLMCIAMAGLFDQAAPRAVLVIAAIALIWLMFRLDRSAENRLYPSGALSLRSPVGLALWILFLVGIVQTSVTLFLPLLLQVVYGVTPLFISFVTIVVSLGWTTGTFLVSDWSGARERTALWSGPIFMLIGMVGIAATAHFPALALLTFCAFVLGFGIGTHNVHLLARTMAGAEKGEEAITAASMPSIRSLGTAFGAAQAGMLSNMVGFDNAADRADVAAVVTVVYGVDLIPAALAVLFMFMLVRLGVRATSEH
jgi:MFS family permease